LRTLQIAVTSLPSPAPVTSWHGAFGNPYNTVLATKPDSASHAAKNVVGP